MPDISPENFFPENSSEPVFPKGPVILKQFPVGSGGKDRILLRVMHEINCPGDVIDDTDDWD